MILAIESSSTDLSVALANDGGELMAVDGWSSERRGGPELLPRIGALLATQGLRLEHATGLAVGIGPGSFTGLRVGMSLGKGLAFALRRPIVGIGSLEAWLDADREAVAAISRAGAREAYVLMRGEAEVRIVDRDDLRTITGDRPAAAPLELATAFELATGMPPLRAAGAIATRAAERLEREPEGDDLARLEPAYLRAPRGVGQLATPEAMAEAIRWP